MHRLVWAFAGRTYHIVGNLMSRLILLSMEVSASCITMVNGTGMAYNRVSRQIFKMPKVLDSIIHLNGSKCVGIKMTTNAVFFFYVIFQTRLFKIFSNKMLAFRAKCLPDYQLGKTLIIQLLQIQADLDLACFLWLFGMQIVFEILEHLHTFPSV